MKLKYLGTAAAEGFPAVFCNCENCRRSKMLGGVNIRTRSQAMIDEWLLIDFPCDVYYHSLKYNIDLIKTNHCVITHIHEDHLYPIEFNYLKTGFSHPPENWEGFHIYGSADVYEIIKNPIEQSNGLLIFHEIKPFETVQIGKYRVTALKAFHGTRNPYIYWISDGEKDLLYAHDTDIFPMETWQYLNTMRPCFDMVSLDCTEGAHMELNYNGHMCLGRNIECRKRMEDNRLIHEDTMVVLNHFSHNGLDACYDDFSRIADKQHFVVSYDGMELQF